MILAGVLEPRACMGAAAKPVTDGPPKFFTQGVRWSGRNTHDIDQNQQFDPLARCMLFVATAAGENRTGSLPCSTSQERVQP
jgi:hypothetical protein